MKRSFLTIALTLSFPFVYSQATIETDYMLLGKEELPQNGQNISDTFILVDYTKGALREGLLKMSPGWSPDSNSAGSFAFGRNVTASGEWGSTAFGESSNAKREFGATARRYQATASGKFGATA
jgi:hypothetical protein